MRLVGSAVELESAIKLARSEAENAFGCGDLILEKAVIRPRHVEIQVFADQHGGVIHFGERDCSVQRRHQKVIEEAPCPVMNTGLRERMAQAATEAARAVNYVGAGTVEFLLDEGGEFYFLEMNTRLQVEHPVTEMVTGQDLVALQLKVAQGGALELNQQQVEFKGHAIEARLYAEDPGMDFLPCTGPVHLWQEPRGEGIRVDAGITTGGEVSPFYDSMVAKVIAHGDTREQARQRLLRALDDTVLIGTANNRDFLIAALGQARFASGEATTAFLEEVFPDGVHSVAPGMENYSAAAVIQHVLGRDAALGEALPLPDELLGWSSTADLESVHRYAQTQETLSLSVRAMDKSSFRVHHLDRVDEVEVLEITDSQVRLMINSRTWRATFFAVGVETLHLVVKGLGQFSVTNVLAAGGRDADASGGPSLAAPMHGVMIAIEVKVDERVCKGDTLAVMEAMKMQHALVASVDGTVTSIAVAVGDQVGAGDLLLEVAPDNASTDSNE